MVYTTYDDPFRKPEVGPTDGPQIEYEPIALDGIITPAFADWHFHWVQHRVAGVRDKPLLQWLREDAWPEEQRFNDRAFADVAAEGFAKAQIAAGTLTGGLWGSSHPDSVRAAKDAGVRFALGGPALMTKGETDALLRPREQAIDDLKDLYPTFEKSLAVAPRFALSCSAGDLAAFGEHAFDYSLWVQTHLAENEAEVALVREKFPDCAGYLDVYDRAGLVTPRTLLAHCVHLSDDEWRTIKQRGAIVVHCPTSNEALASGRMPLEKVRAQDIPWVLGTDIGAGPDPCMLDVIESVTRIHDWNAPVTFVEAFFRATVSLEILESYAARKSRVTRMLGTSRAGFIEFRRPDSIDPMDRDPEAILSAIVEMYRDNPTGAIQRVFDKDANLLYQSPTA